MSRNLFIKWWLWWRPGGSGTLAAACRGMILSRPEYSTGSTREPPGFPASKGTLFAKNRHDNVVSGLDVCLWVSLIGPMAEEVREEDSGDEVGRR
ncbi:hypothetical protein BGY98DRAFT_991170 [Russula aff. rugulosa BPL654]|nr:hypothetical protein BGY98DRAFT_991170 [Russula aff. rugulosa BPL654]